MTDNYSEFMTGENLAKFFLQNFTDYYETKKLATETWETRSGSLLRFEHQSYVIDVSYDHKKVKNAISCTLESPDIHMIDQLTEQELFEGDIFDSDGELVILKPDVSIHFIRNTNGGIESIKTVYPLLKTQIELIQNIYQKIDNTEVRSRLRI